MIYPHCLCRMRQIELVSAGRALRTLMGGGSLLIILILSILSADEGDDWTFHKATMKSGREAVEQAEGEAKKDDDKEGTGIPHVAASKTPF